MRTGLFFFTVAFCFSCNSTTNTPTQGKQTIFIDEAFSQLFDAEVAAFEGIYKQSELVVRYLPEADVVNALLNDSVRVVVLARNLTEKEKQFFNSKKSFPVSTRIAQDGLAFIAHKENPVTELTFNQLKEIFSGKISKWKLLDSSIKEGSSQDLPITIVFDNEKSCNVRMVKEKILGEIPFPENCFAVQSSPEVVDYVSQNQNALGIIGVNWISDADDTLTRNFMKKVNVLGVSSEKNPGDFFQPFQAYIYSREYPFCRDVYIINREGRTGLGTGFAAFVAGEKGQLIILKAGMVPATQPVRMVTINNQ